MDQVELNLLTQAVTLHQRGRQAEAEDLYKAILARNPRHPDALHLLGVVELNRRDFAKARRLIEKAIKIKSNDAAYHSNLGVVLKDQGNFADALAASDRALQLQPNYPDAWCNRGLVLEQLGRYEDALISFDKAIAQNPSFALAYSNRGITLQSMGRYEDALQNFRQAFALDPSHIDYAHNYATILALLRRPQEARRAYDLVLRAKPDHVAALEGRGEVLVELGEIDSGLIDIRRVLELEPQHPNANWAMAYMHLSDGDFTKGWPLFEYRFQNKCSHLNTSRPRWDGVSRVDSLLLWSEQGIGDEVFFAGWLSAAEGFAPQVQVAVDARLIAVYERAFPALRFLDKARKIPESSYAAHLPMGSLPLALMESGKDWQAARRKAPYLQADPERVAQLRSALVRPGELLCGLTWRSTRPTYGAEKSLPLESLLPILQMPGMTFLDLQYGDTAEDLRALSERTGVQVVHHDPIDNLNDLPGHLALIEACDLLVGVCNATAHLAGALDKPGFILAPHGRSKIWYWANRTADAHSLWYPSLRLFDQTLDLSWEEALSKLGPAVREHVRR
jgi:tetratricopeptide (TPR) repeat protein